MNEDLSLILVKLHIKSITYKTIKEVNGESFKSIGQFEFGTLAGIQFPKGGMWILWT